MTDKPKMPYRDPKYSGWPGPEPVAAEPEQIDLEEAVHASHVSDMTPAPKKRAKLKAVDAE
jgi:hypothetical protein